MQKLKIFLWNIKEAIIQLPIFIKLWLCTFPIRCRILTGRVVAVRAWVETDSESRIIPHNLGDDINLPLLETLLGRKVECVGDEVCMPRPGIMAVGSMFPWHRADGLYVWGSGVLEDTTRPIWGNPIRVCAVRGPRTRQYLLANGIDCPEVYGDPALLLPLIYPSIRQHRYKIGIIPHWRDIESPHVQSFLQSHPDVHLINFVKYDTWQHVIDQICSCELIISSSLHGLILSDAYSIPNVFAQFSDEVEGGDYKYHDYMEGIGRKWQEPLDFRKVINLQPAIRQSALYQSIHFNPKPLLKAFPFPLDFRFRKMQE